MKHEIKTRVVVGPLAIKLGSEPSGSFSSENLEEGIRKLQEAVKGAAKSEDLYDRLERILGPTESLLSNIMQVQNEAALPHQIRQGDKL